MKKAMSLLVALTFVLLTIPVSIGSAQSQNADIPMPRGRVCDNCGVGQMFVSNYGAWTAWYLIQGTRQCPTYPNLSDPQQERGRPVTERCNHCQSSYQYMETARRWLCTHV